MKKKNEKEMDIVFYLIEVGQWVAWKKIRLGVIIVT